MEQVFIQVLCIVMWFGFKLSARSLAEALGEQMAGRSHRREIRAGAALRPKFRGFQRFVAAT
jgi:hypothetical protein